MRSTRPATASGSGLAEWTRPESGALVNIHLQTAEGFTLPGDTSETSNYFHEDIVAEPVVLGANGFIEIPKGTGLGVPIVPELVLKRTIRAERVR